MSKKDIYTFNQKKSWNERKVFRGRKPEIFLQQKCFALTFAITHTTISAYPNLYGRVYMQLTHPTITNVHMCRFRKVIIPLNKSEPARKGLRGKAKRGAKHCGGKHLFKTAFNISVWHIRKLATLKDETNREWNKIRLVKRSCAAAMSDRQLCLYVCIIYNTHAHTNTYICK